MSDNKEGNKIQKKMLKSWSGEIAYIIEDDKKSNNQESLRQDEKIDEVVKQSTIKLDEDRLNSIRLLKAIKDSLTVRNALCEHNEIPQPKLLIQDKIKASIGTENFKKFEVPKIKPGQFSKDTNIKKPPNYLKLWNEKHKFDVLKTKDERFLRTVGKVSNKQINCESNIRSNQIKSGRKIPYYVQDNSKKGRISQLDNMRDKYDYRHKPETPPARSTSPQRVQKEVYSSHVIKQNTSVNANFKRELIEFKSGTSDFLINSSVNTTNNKPIEIKIEQKTEVGRKITNFLSGSTNEFETDCPVDLMGVLPFIKPKSFSFFSKKSSTNQGVSVSYQDFKPMETIQESDQGLTPNESHVINCDQKNIRKTLINGHDYPQEESNFSFKPKKKFGSKLSYKIGQSEYIPLNQRDEFVYVGRPAKSARFADHPNYPRYPNPPNQPNSCGIGKGCKCQEQTLPMTAQKVDMTPFLVQLLESCLKVPETLKDIRNVNNTFVSDLSQWKTFSYNLIGHNKSPDNNLNRSQSAERNTDDRSCQTCQDCHQILKKIMGILNEKHTRPCLDNNYPDGISCKKCGCGKSDERSRVPGFTSCECGGVPRMGGAAPIPEPPKSLRPIQRTQSISTRTPPPQSSKENEILSYYAKCSVPHQKFSNHSNIERKTLHQPRCAAVDFDSDLDDSPCSHCSSCSSCSNC